MLIGHNMQHYSIGWAIKYITYSSSGVERYILFRIEDAGIHIVLFQRCVAMNWWRIHLHSYGLKLSMV